MTLVVNAERLRFGLFEVDLGSGEVFRSGRRVELQELPFRILAAILTDPGRMLTRGDLIARFWPGSPVSDEDSLNTAIRKIRQSLGDDARNPKYIETVGRRGYRFLMPVRPVKSERTPSLVWIGVLGVEGSLSSGERDFTLGVIEEVITQLSRMASRVKVVALGARGSRELSATEKRTRTSWALDYVLACAARKNQSQLRITGKLFRAGDRNPHWSQSFDYANADLLATPEDAATHIVDGVLPLVFHNLPSNPQA
jgi:DNA-binding winged helix-turn-helix (wHTH) protein/TolB-like protein